MPFVGLNPNPSAVKLKRVRLLRTDERSENTAGSLFPRYEGLGFTNNNHHGRRKNNNRIS